MRAGGFTLLELLVALAIGALVVVGVAAAVGLTADVASRGRDSVDERLRLEAARSMVRTWLEGAHLTGELSRPGFEGRDASELGRPTDHISFVSLDAGPVAETPGSEVRFAVGVEAAGLVAEYSELAPGRRSGSIVLAPDVHGMNVRYLVRVGGRLRWLDGWSSRVRLPVAVEIQFYPADGNHEEALRMPLLVALPKTG